MPNKLRDILCFRLGAMSLETALSQVGKLVQRQINHKILLYDQRRHGFFVKSPIFNTVIHVFIALVAGDSGGCARILQNKETHTGSLLSSLKE